MDQALPYRLLDSGRGRKLERVGDWLLDRPAPQAFWARRRSDDAWKAADAVHHRSDDGGGRWEFRRRLPESWLVEHGGVRLRVRPTPFGHLGLFAEHEAAWSFLRERLAALGSAPKRVLNLFAYTGGATLAAALAGAEVCHVDAAAGVVDWARENARENGLETAPIRWIVDDCRVFIEREIRRGRRYDAILLDPPTFGRGAKREVWKIEDDLPPLLDACRRILSDDRDFVILSAHTPGFTPRALENVAADVFPDASFTAVEMTISGEDRRLLPSGAVVRIAFPRSTSPARA